MHEIFGNYSTKLFPADFKHICGIAHTTASLCRKRRPIDGFECGCIRHVQSHKSISCRDLYRAYYRRTTICHRRMLISWKQLSSRQNSNDCWRGRDDGLRNYGHGMVFLTKKRPAFAGRIGHIIQPIIYNVNYLPWRIRLPIARRISLTCFLLIAGASADLARPVTLWKSTRTSSQAVVLIS